MTIFEEMYKKSPELSKFYRFEGLNSYSHFPVGNENMYFPQDSGYILFTKYETSSILCEKKIETINH